MVFKIQIMAWDGHTNLSELNLLMNRIPAL